MPAPTGTRWTGREKWAAADFSFANQGLGESAGGGHGLSSVRPGGIPEGDAHLAAEQAVIPANKVAHPRLQGNAAFPFTPTPAQGRTRISA